MVGFLHKGLDKPYQTINLDILKTIIEKELKDFLEFSKQILKLSS